MVDKVSDELSKENMNYISRNQKEISEQLEFIGKNEVKITNKFYTFKNYKNYNIIIQSEFIGKNDRRKFYNQQNILNKTLWILNIKRIKPKLYRLVMDNQIKYYLHIQQVKRLHNEISIIKKHKRECKIQNIIDQIQQRIKNIKDLIFKIIGLYDMMEYYYCKGNVIKLKKLMKIKEEEFYGYFQLEELDKYHMLAD